METISEYKTIESVQPLITISEPAYPLAMYNGIPVMITDCVVMQSGKKNVEIETVSGERVLVEGPCWIGGQGYVYPKTNRMWTALENVTLRSEIKPVCAHSVCEVVEVSDDDYPTGFSNGDVTYSSGTHFESVCLACGEHFDDVPVFEEYDFEHEECNIQDEE